jgi:NAD(P)-dependent dehydrogenase (short-subunit alcohol dehydrogenase family)
VVPWRSERTFAVNYLAAVFATDLLLPLLAAAPSAHVVNVASASHLSASLLLEDLDLSNRPYSPVDAYGQSKLALVVHSKSSRPRWATTDRVPSEHAPESCRPVCFHAMFAVTGARMVRSPFQHADMRLE